MIPILAAESMFDGIKAFINAICQPHWFLILSVLGLGVFLAGYRFFTQPKVAGPLAAVLTLAFIASCFDPNFLLIVQKADNVPS